MASSSTRPVLFLHGYWHGSWCWTEVLSRVTAGGVRALAVDMAGHGMHARRPASVTARPFDPQVRATEPSPVAGVDLDQAGDLLASQIATLGGGEPVVVVAHSMGGTVLTRAAQQVPDLVAHAVYLTAFMPASGTPALAYVQAPEAEGELVVPSLVADPQAIGALRLDTVETDPQYRHQLRQAFFGDVDEAVADSAIALLSPDAPAGIAAGATTLTAEGWGRIPRTYVVCTQDLAIREPLQRRFIAEADAAYPDNPTSVTVLESSHSPFLSRPDDVAGLVLSLAG